MFAKNNFDAYKLRNFTSAILDVKECSPSLGQNNFAIFVYYEPDGKLSKSARNILSSLQKQSIDTLLISNHYLSDEQYNDISGLVHKVIIRSNRGFDFGAYKDAVSYLIKNELVPKKLLFLNDSVYFFSKGLENFVQSLLGPEDIVCSFENCDVDHAYHIQSFALGVSENVFLSNSFRNFWTRYRPVSNRLHAIENGEKLLSVALLKSARTMDVIYPIERIVSLRDDLVPDDFKKFIVMPIDRSLLKNPNDEFLDMSQIKYRIFSNIRNPIHDGTYYFSRIGCPIVKKDIVFRNRYKFWEVSEIFRDVYDKEELDEFFLMLRKKGTIKGSPFFTRLLWMIGAR
ncbi:MAG: rhamnan synthesis F family protein [Lentilitoribacter sp.]